MIHPNFLIGRLRGDLEKGKLKCVFDDVEQWLSHYGNKDEEFIWAELEKLRPGVRREYQLSRGAKNKSHDMSFVKFKRELGARFAELDEENRWVGEKLLSCKTEQEARTFLQENLDKMNPEFREDVIDAFLKELE